MGQGERPPAGGMLAGVTLLDFSSMGPGPRATRLLADYGMRVVKVRPPRQGTRMLSAPWFAYSANRGIHRCTSTSRTRWDVASSTA